MSGSMISAMMYTDPCICTLQSMYNDPSYYVQYIYIVVCNISYSVQIYNNLGLRFDHVAAADVAAAAAAVSVSYRMKCPNQKNVSQEQKVANLWTGGATVRCIASLMYLRKLLC